MLGFTIKRLLWAIPTLILVSSLTFLLQALVPGDAAQSILGANATAERLAELRAQLGLDLPIWQQYLNYLGGLLRGDMGTSLLTGQSVTALIGERLPVTLSLLALTIVVAVIIGVFLGVTGALRPKIAGKIIDVVAMVGLAVPNFWAGLMLVSLFAVQLRLLPAIGYVPLEVSLGGWVRSLSLPVAALSLVGIATITKTTRDAVQDTASRDFIRTLRANGATRSSLIWRHILKNSSFNIVTVLSLVLIAALTGTVFVESVFVIPGLGIAAATGALTGDIPVVQGVGIVFTIIVILINLGVDLGYTLLNPKVRIS